MLTNNNKSQSFLTRSFGAPDNHFVDELLTHSWRVTASDGPGVQHATDMSNPTLLRFPGISTKWPSRPRPTGGQTEPVSGRETAHDAVGASVMEDGGPGTPSGPVEALILSLVDMRYERTVKVLEECGIRTWMREVPVPVEDETVLR
jgi:hypothetical protein